MKIGLCLASLVAVAACSGSTSESPIGSSGGSGGGASGGSSSSGGGSSSGGADGGSSSGTMVVVMCTSASACPSGQICCGAKTTGTKCEAACASGQRKVCQNSRIDCGPGEHCKMEAGFGLCERSKVGQHDGGVPTPVDAGGD